MHKKQKDRITLIPYGGLANRMRSIDSAITLCKENERELKIIWFKHEALNSDFKSLFEPIEIEGVSLRDGSLADYYIYDRPRRRNFNLPRIFQKLIYDFKIYEDTSARKYHAGEAFDEFSLPGKGYVVSCYQMTPSKLRFSMFKPVAAIRERISKMTSSMDVENCIGVHIRRGDNVYSIDKSPDELFIEKMHEKLRNKECTSFYLATDSQEVKEKISSIFGEKVSYLDEESSRLDESGMQDAVLEMYILSKMKSIIGSYGSTYSQTAAWIGGKPYIEIKKQEDKQ